MRYQAVADIDPFWVGETPQAVEFDITDETNSVVELPPGTLVSAELYAPRTVTDPAELGAVLDLEESTVTVTWPELVGPFAVGGVYTLRLRLTIEGRANYLTAYIPVLAFDGWLTPDEARQWWPGAPDDVPLLMMLLHNAREAIEAVALARYLTPAPSPEARNAQLLQARAIYTLGQTSPQEEVGMESLSVRVYPMDWNIRQLVRPKRVRPVAS